MPARRAVDSCAKEKRRSIVKIRIFSKTRDGKTLLDLFADGFIMPDVVGSRIHVGCGGDRRHVLQLPIEYAALIRSIWFVAPIS
jgi:hypothetical protein